MSLVYIRFFNRDDEAAGLVQLARHTRVDALPGGLYVVRSDDLRWLDEAGLNYRRATESELGSASEGIRDPAAAHLQ
jgi:hypothetical protein